ALLTALEQPLASGNLDTEISRLAYDSRQAAPGVLFAALRGAKADGHQFIEQAVRAGVSAVVAEIAPPADCDTQWIHVPDSRAALAALSARFFDEPSCSLIVTAVTGTNGKTTTAFLIHHLLNAAHVRCGLVGT